MSKILLLHTASGVEASEEIQTLGGRVTQELTPNILLAKVPKDFDEHQLKKSTTRIPPEPELDESSGLAVKAWRRRVNRTPSEKEKETDGLKWDADGYQPPMVNNAPVHSKDPQPGPPAIVNNDSLFGKVAVGLCIVSCNGGLEFSEQETANVVGQTAEGAGFLAGHEDAAKVLFSWDQHVVNIPGDTQIPGCTTSNCLSGAVYNGKLYCVYQGASSKDYDLFYQATSSDGVWSTQKQINGAVMGPAGSSALATVVFNGKLYCFHTGQPNADAYPLYYNIFDGETWTADASVPDTSTGSGGLSAVVYGGKLYCFHQGPPGQNTQILFNVFDGSKWVRDAVVPSTSSAASMSAVVFNDQIYLLYQSSLRPDQVWYNVYAKSAWLGDKQIQGASTSGGISAAVNGDGKYIYCFHQGTGTNSGKPVLNVFQGDYWTTDVTIGGVKMSGNPSAVWFSGQTYLLHRVDGGGSSGVSYRAFDLIEPDAYNPQDQRNFETYESIWRNSALKKMGYSQGLQGVNDFADYLCTKFQTTRAYVAFFIKFPQQHFAYMSGVHICMQYDNDGWGPPNIYKVFAHESCHIFQAADEYRDDAGTPCDCNAVYGIYKVRNENCWDCVRSPWKQMDCIMNQNSTVMCGFTKGQIGWIPRSALHAFHSRDDGTLAYTAFDGVSWWDEREVPWTDSSSNPGAVEFDGKLYCFHHGKDYNGELGVNTFDGSNWSGNSIVGITGKLIGGPSAVVYDGKIYCFYQYNVDDRAGQLCYVTYDGTKWTDHQVEGILMVAQIPSAVVYNGKIFCFYAPGPGTNVGPVSYTTFDGTGWSGISKISNSNVQWGPSATVYNNNIYCFYLPDHKANRVGCQIYDGENWSRIDGTSADGTISWAPSAIAYQDHLYCFYQGVPPPPGLPQLRYNILIQAGKPWSGGQPVPGAFTSAGPGTAFATFNPPSS